MKPVPVTARDLNSDESDAEDTENVNTKNIRGSKTERIQGAKMIAINNELQEIEQKWWLQGDAESVKRSILAQKE